MKTKLGILVLALPLFAAPGRGLAMMELTEVSREQAKELGMEIRAKAAGPAGVRVELEFKTEGKLKDFGPDRNSRVDLWITKGKKFLLAAALQMERPAPGRVAVSLFADRSQLDSMALVVVVGSGLMPGGGYLLPLKDFVDPERAVAPAESR